MARPQHISDDTIIEALTAQGDVTADDLAHQLGIGQSTAAKRLAALETAGSALRQSGGRVNGVRVADRWSAVVSPSRGTAPDPITPDAGADRDSDRGNPDPIDPAPSSAGEEIAPDGGGERLGRGALGTLVRDYLAARPDEDLGPTQVGKGLGRSQGAVSNALARLEAAGEARLVSASPRRYRIITENR